MGITMAEANSRLASITATGDLSPRLLFSGTLSCDSAMGCSENFWKFLNRQTLTIQPSGPSMPPN